MLLITASDAGGDPHQLAGQGPEDGMKCDADVLQLIAVSADRCLLSWGAAVKDTLFLYQSKG